MQSVNNFSFYQLRVEEKKPEEKGKNAGEEKNEEQTIPRESQETVVLTGSADIILSAIAKATVPGAAPAMSPTGGGDGDEWQQILEEYYELEATYEENKENMNYDELMDAISEMQGKLDSILGGDFPDIPNDILEQINSEWTEKVQEKYEAQMSYWNGELPGNDGYCNMTYEKWLQMHHEMESTLEQMSKYKDLNELDSGLQGWLVEKNKDIYDEWKDQIEANMDGWDKDQIFEELNQLEASLMDKVNEYSQSLDNNQLKPMMDAYIDTEMTKMAQMQGSIPPANNGNGTEANAQALLRITELNEPHYEFIFNHQGDLENYRYFQAQITQNQVFLNALYHYRDLLSDKLERGISAPPNLLQELNHEIARYEELLSSARNYLSQINIAMGNANVPNEY